LGIIETCEIKSCIFRFPSSQLPVSVPELPPVVVMPDAGVSGSDPFKIKTVELQFLQFLEIVAETVAVITAAAGVNVVVKWQTAIDAVAVEKFAIVASPWIFGTAEMGTVVVSRKLVVASAIVVAEENMKEKLL